MASTDDAPKTSWNFKIIMIDNITHRWKHDGLKMCEKSNTWNLSCHKHLLNWVLKSTVNLQMSYKFIVFFFCFFVILVIMMSTNNTGNQNPLRTTCSLFFRSYYIYLKNIMDILFQHLWVENFQVLQSFNN